MASGNTNPFIDRVLDYLYRLQITDIRASGRNERDELAPVQTALPQLVFKDLR
jgi:hypothetical protein